MIRRSLVLIGGCLLMGAASARAQESFRLDAKIPFEFQAGRRTFPAGEYQLTLDQSQAPGVLTIRSREGKAGEFVLLEPTDNPQPARDGRLVFEHEGESYVLSELFAAGSRVGGELLGAHVPEERPQPAAD
jgi:hypothetical protein